MQFHTIPALGLVCHTNWGQLILDPFFDYPGLNDFVTPETVIFKKTLESESVFVFHYFLLALKLIVSLSIALTH